MSLKKLPLGVVPKEHHDRDRELVILDAMRRYAVVEKVVPEEWLAELHELQRRRARREDMRI